jgi:RHS repeat-associated protein
MTAALRRKGERYVETRTQVGVFTGIVQNTIVGMYDTPNRECDTTSGRWLSPDPLGGDVTNPQSLNRYAYVLNNPTTLIDPLGLDNIKVYEDASDLINSGCTLNGMAMPCGMVNNAIWSGAAARCPNDDCFGIKATQGPGGSTIFQQWIPPETTTGHVDGMPAVFQTTGYWKTVGTVEDWLASFVQSTPLSWSINIPVPVPGPTGLMPGPAGAIIVAAVHVQGASKGCVGGGWWVGTPGEKTVGAGPLVFGNLENARAILSGPSWSINIQPTPFIGFQVMWNSSGVLAGPTVALVPGAALSRTTSVCR